MRKNFLDTELEEWSSRILVQSTLCIYPPTHLLSISKLLMCLEHACAAAHSFKTGFIFHCREETLYNANDNPGTLILFSAWKIVDKL